MPGASLIDPNAPNIIGQPGANTSGTNIAVPGGGGSDGAGALGGSTNPLNPTFPSGQNMPNISSLFGSINPAPFPANGTGVDGTGGAGGSGAGGLGDIFNLSGGRPQPPGGQTSATFMSNLITGFKNAGLGSAQGSLLAQFLMNGAGFNPQVANAMIAAMQPQVERGKADILEQFGSMGLGGSSAAAIGLGDYESQVQLNEGAILANMYQNSVADYLGVLMGSKQTYHGPDLLSQVLGTMGTLSGASSGLITAVTGGKGV